MTGPADSELSMEERILFAVKLTLTNVVKDTATPRGMRHPLSDKTIEDLRQCLALISARERELATAAGSARDQRPHYVDAPVSPQTAVVQFPKSLKGEPEGG